MSLAPDFRLDNLVLYSPGFNFNTPIETVIDKCHATIAFTVLLRPTMFPSVD